MRREKGEGSTVYVWLDAAHTQPDFDQTHDRSHPDTDQADDQTPPGNDLRGSRIGAQAELVDSLLDQVAYMRDQLAEEREARRRADTIIAQLTHANATLAQRVPELEAPSEPQESSERVSEDPYSTHAPPTPDHPVERPSWWRRFFGSE